MKITNLFKTSLAAGLTALLLISTSQATITYIGEIPQAGNPTDELAAINAELGTSYDVYFGKFDYTSQTTGVWDGDGLFDGPPELFVSGWTETEPATADVEWNLPSPYLVGAIIVKTANKISLYQVSADMGAFGEANVVSPGGKDSISHIAFFGGGNGVPDGGSTIFLLGSMLGGLALFRRRFTAA